MGHIVLSSHHQQMQVITNKEEKLHFYFTTRGCPVGTSFQHKLTNLCTCEPVLELGKESRKQSLCYSKDDIFLFVLAWENMEAVKTSSILLHNPSEFILTTRKYLKTASERYHRSCFRKKESNWITESNRNTIHFLASLLNIYIRDEWDYKRNILTWSFALLTGWYAKTPPTINHRV